MLCICQSSTLYKGFSSYGKGQAYYSSLGFSTVMHGHITALSGIILVGSKLAHEIFEREASLLENSSFSVLARNNIVRSQGRC